MSTAIAIRTAPETVLLEKVDELAVHIPALDRRLINASGTTAIAELPVDMTEQPAKDSQQGRVGAVLRFAFRDLDLKKPPTHYDVNRLIDFVTMHHERFTTMDIRTAFDMFLAAKLGECTPETHKHFQNFSPAYYGTILRAYAQEQRRARHEARHKVQKAQLLLATPEKPACVWEFGSLTVIRQQVANYLKTGQAHVHAVGFTHDWLVRLGVCTATEPPTKEEIVDAMDKLKLKKGAGFAFSWNMQRLLSGERVPDAEWVATMEKREKSMWADIGTKGTAVLSIIDAELSAIEARAKAAGHDVHQQAAA